MKKKDEVVREMTDFIKSIGDFYLNANAEALASLRRHSASPSASRLKAALSTQRPDRPLHAAFAGLLGALRSYRDRFYPSQKDEKSARCITQKEPCSEAARFPDHRS
ncbi:MAG: hypothetical protein WDN29_01285 [Methylovirgula sp.]